MSGKRHGTFDSRNMDQARLRNHKIRVRLDSRLVDIEREQQAKRSILRTEQRTMQQRMQELRPREHTLVVVPRGLPAHLRENYLELYQPNGTFSISLNEFDERLVAFKQDRLEARSSYCRHFDPSQSICIPVPNRRSQIQENNCHLKLTKRPTTSYVTQEQLGRRSRTPASHVALLARRSASQSRRAASAS